MLTENFTLPAGWAEGHTHLTVVSPEPFPVHLVSMGWSPATPEGGLTADVIDVGTGQESDFKHAGESVKGAILLVHTDVLQTWDDLFNEYLNDPAVEQRAIDAGASAILWMSTRPYLLLYRHIFSHDGTIDRIAAGSRRTRRRAAHGAIDRRGPSGESQSGYAEQNQRANRLGKCGGGDSREREAGRIRDSGGASGFLGIGNGRARQWMQCGNGD